MTSVNVTAFMEDWDASFRSSKDSLIREMQTVVNMLQNLPIDVTVLDDSTRKRLVYLQQAILRFAGEMDKYYTELNNENAWGGLTVHEIKARDSPSDGSVEELLNYVPTWPLLVNALSAFFCMGCSCVYHLIYVYSSKVNTNFARLDYAGISILILGSCIPPYYYGFACPNVSFWRAFSISFMTTSCS